MKRICFLVGLFIILFGINPININADENFSIIYNDKDMLSSDVVDKQFAEFGGTFVPIRFIGDILNFKSS